MARHRELGLTDHEYELIAEKLEREPNEVELAVFSLMWSEHCGYKHSRRLLKTLPTEGPKLVLGPGENAGAVAVGDGLVCAFKVESHNHPSAVEPYQGAATGVGGILRDVFTMGARPIALMDSLRFGSLDAPRMRHAGLGDAVFRYIGHSSLLCRFSTASHISRGSKLSAASIVRITTQANDTAPIPGSMVARLPS